ncbi:MAG: RNA-directed DNA polymerase, partial [Propionibacteriaceae bacterium]
LFAKWQKRRSQPARADYVSARKVTQKALRLARDNWMWRLGSGPGGNKFFWTFVKSRSKVSPAASVFRVNGENVSEPERVATAFSELFSRNFSSAADDHPFVRRHPSGTEPPILCEMSVTAAGVFRKLQEVKGNAGPGPDGVQGVVLKSCAASLAPSLARLFNCSLQQGALPQGWKAAAVVPIPKGGDKEDLENYRPISMTSLVGKALEKLVRDRIQTFMDENNIIPDCQHGFRPRRSCTTHLGKTLDRWASVVDQKAGSRIHAITLDWKKAFDRVPHGRLLDKLSHYGVNGTLLRWAESFLRGRTQYVVYSGAKSVLRAVDSGVIQGSVLGPLFFIIYAADL